MTRISMWTRRTLKTESCVVRKTKGKDDPEENFDLGVFVFQVRNSEAQMQFHLVHVSVE